jgi:hypothetical protein
MTEILQWYNPARRVEEEVPAPVSDAQSIELLSGPPDSDEFIEEYRLMARDGIGCCGGLDPHGRGALHEAPEGTAPKLAERVLTQPHAAEGKEKGKPPAGVNTSIGGI